MPKAPLTGKWSKDNIEQAEKKNDVSQEKELRGPHAPLVKALQRAIAKVRAVVIRLQSDTLNRHKAELAM